MTAIMFPINRHLKWSRDRRPGLEAKVEKGVKRLDSSAEAATIASVRVELAAAALLRERERILGAGLRIEH